MNTWNDEGAPFWRRVHGIGRPWTPTQRGRRGCMLLLLGGFAMIVMALLLAGAIAVLS